MAAAALFGGAFVSACVSLLIERLAPSGTIWDLFKCQNPNSNKLLRKLKINLIAVSKVLDDAEQKEIKNPHVKTWLDELKDVVYDADDLLAEIVYDFHAVAGDSGSAVGQKRKYSASLDDLSGEETKFGEKLEGILERLAELMEEKVGLGLVEVTGQGFARYLPPERQTTSMVTGSEVYGRENDKRAITKLLMSKETDGTDGLGIIAIVGMGGLGKTTLAKLVYGQKQILDQFQHKAWVCVSEETNVFVVTRNILNGFTPAVRGLKSMTPDLLQNKLKDTLTGKRFLLVLDDVWDESPESWDTLVMPLKHGLKGSRIIVTTRNHEVASLVSTVAAYPLKELSKDECWSLFARCAAFTEKDQSAYPDLEAIGRKIVAKCGGLPLAANALGGLLRTRRDSTEWEHIMKSEIWNLEDLRILPALRLSYHYLPSSHKRCFAYSSLFPKNYEFEMDELVRLWMANGIFDSHQGKRPMEEIGHNCFGALLSRSFFQISSVRNSCFVMHDLIHDLAKSVARDFYYTLEDDNPSSPPRKPRHVSYLSSARYNVSQKFGGIRQNHSLRSFLPIHLSKFYRHAQQMDKDVVQHLLGASTCLRILSLSYYVNIKEVPEFIGNLKLLRFLDLSGTSIRRLSDVICTLWNLETLLLENCKKLEEVPDSIVDLKGLHFLNLAGTAIGRLPTNLCKLVNLCFLDVSRTKLQEMPPRLGNLTRLQNLSDFFVGKDNSCSTIKEFKELSKLKGKLRIWNLQNVTNAQVASGSHLKGKKHLKDLELSWKGDDAVDSLHELKVLEALEPPHTLEILTVRGYRGTKFPEWVGHHSFSNLASLKIKRCRNCFELPPLGQLESLKELRVSGCDGIVVVGLSFYGNSLATTNTPFKSLEVLRFKDMPGWITWEQHDGAFPSLRELHLSYCWNLENALPRELPSLKKLQIQECVRLKAPFPRAPAIVEVHLDYKNCSVDLNPGSDLYLAGGDKFCHSGRFLDLDQMLGDIRQMGKLVADVKRVDIAYCDLASGNHQGTESCSSLEGVLKHFECLDSLTIRHCPRVVSFPECELASPSLTNLQLHNLPSLKSVPEQMKSILPSLVDLSLRECPELESFPEGGLPSRLESLKIIGCKKLLAGRKQWNLHVLPSLSSLTINGGDDETESFPEAMLLPPSLTTLAISCFDGLKRLDYKGLEHLTSLQTLRISNFSSLEKLAEEEEEGGLLPRSLTTLDISWLPKLKSLRPIQRLTSLTSLSISKCDEISEVEVVLPQSLTSLVIWDLPKLKSLRPIQRLTSLTSLSVTYCDVEVVLLPSTITSLTVNGIPKMKSLDGWGLQRLTCLEELMIRGCENLESIITTEEEALPSSSLRLVQLRNCPRLKYIQRGGEGGGEAFPFTSLQRLFIAGCPLLSEKYQWEGEERHRISHIPEIYII